MVGRGRFQFSVWNLMLAVASAAVWCAVMRHAMGEKLTAPAVVSLMSVIPVFLGALLRGLRGLQFGLVFGLVFLGLGVVVMALLVAVGVHV